MGMEWSLLAVTAVLLMYVLASDAEMRRALRIGAPPPPAPRLPTLSLICPMKGRDPGAADNIRSLLRLEYPGRLELLFVLDDENEPVLPLLRDALAETERLTTAVRAAGAFDEDDEEEQKDLLEHRPTARILFCGAPPARRTGKLHAMMAGVAEAHGELLGFVDSDTRPEPHTFSRLVETLLDQARAGTVFAPVVASCHPRTAGDAAYALLLNGMYGPLVALEANRHGRALPFVMGQAMVVTREALDAIGGLSAVEGELVDDMALGMRIHAAGLRNVVASEAVPIIQAGMDPAEFLRTFARWIAFSRTGLPGRAFKSHAYARAAAFWISLLATVAAAVLGVGTIPTLLALSPAAAVCWSNYHLHVTAGGARFGVRLFWVPAAILLLGPFMFVWLALHPHVTWRGRRYRLDGGWRLA